MFGFAAAQLILELLLEYYEGNEHKAYATFIAGCLILIGIIVAIARFVSLA